MVDQSRQTGKKHLFISYDLKTKKYSMCTYCVLCTFSAHLNLNTGAPRRTSQFRSYSAL